MNQLESSGFRVSRPLAWAFAILLLFGCSIRQDELECEEAVARLESCCPGFDTRPLICEFTPSQGCDSSPYYPAITIDESKTIRATSCEALINSGECERAQHATRPTTSETPGGS